MNILYLVFNIQHNMIRYKWNTRNKTNSETNTIEKLN